MNLTVTPSPRSTVEVSVLIGGAAQPLYRRADGRLFVAGIPGSAYTLSVRNLTGGRIEVIASADGRNVLDDDAADVHASRGLIIGPYVTYVFRGWRVSDQQTREFLFGEPSSSVAAQATGSTANVGVLGFAAWRHREAYVSNVSWHGAPESSYGGLTTRGAAGVAAASAGGEGMMSAGSLGTGIGAYQEDRVGRTSFDRASDGPDTLVIGYDTEAELVRRGIVLAADPDPFPGHRTGYDKYATP